MIAGQAMTQSLRETPLTDEDGQRSQVRLLTHIYPYHDTSHNPYWYAIKGEDDRWREEYRDSSLLGGDETEMWSQAYRRVMNRNLVMVPTMIIIRSTSQQALRRHLSQP